MTTKRVTIKDIADKAGVSIGTVHVALTGKPGVSEETRQRITEVARKYDYRPNSVAASLKRKPVRIAAAFPGPSRENRYYFTIVWEGLRDYFSSMRDYNIELVEVPFYREAEGQSEELSRMLDSRELEGLLTIGYSDSRGVAVLQRFRDRNIPVVLVTSDVPESERLCCVQPNYDVLGRTVSELVSWQAPQGSILLCAGNVVTPAQYEIVLGVESYFQDNGLTRHLIKVHDSPDLDQIHAELVAALKSRPEISACCCVNARSSAMLGRALEDTGRAGSMPAIGCDVFEETIAFLGRGTFTNLVHKNPYSQAYVAAKCLAEFLLHGTRPLLPTLYVGSEIVFRSSLPMLQAGRRSLDSAFMQGRATASKNLP